jgi:hypothetical protein
MMMEVYPGKKTAVFGTKFAWFLIVGNLLLLLVLLNVLPVYRDMSGNELNVFDNVRYSLYVVDAIAATFILFGRPAVTTAVLLITSTFSIGLSEWLLQTPEGPWFIYGFLSLVTAYWDVAVLLWLSRKQQRLQQLLDSNCSDL